MDKIKIETQVSILRDTHVDDIMNCIEVNKERKIDWWKSAGLVLGLAFVQELVLGQQVKGHVAARYSLDDGDKVEIVWVGIDLRVWKNEDEDMSWGYSWGLEMKLRVSIEDGVQENEFDGLCWR